MSIEMMALADIVLTRRLREDHGDIDSLMASIQAHGLLHPIVVDAEDRLVAGGRRLAAVRNLGQREIAIRRLGDLTDQQRREIELDENVRRKDLTAYERSKFVTELVDTAKESITGTLPDSGRVSRRGPAPDLTSDRRIAERVGIPQQTIQEARQHVAAVEAHPEMADWPQRQVLDYVRRERRPEPTVVPSSITVLTTSPVVMARGIADHVDRDFIAELIAELYRVTEREVAE